MTKIIGPILFAVGPPFADRMRGRIEKFGLWGAGLFGLLFARSFCLSPQPCSSAA